jgi:hypothetical protein
MLESSRSRGAAVTITACYPLAVALILLKHDFLLLGGGFRQIAWQTSEPQQMGLALHHVGLFAGDILEAFGLLPLILLVAFGWTGDRTRTIATAAVVTCLTAIAGASWLTLLALGRLPTLQLARDYFYALRTDPGLVAAADYVPREAEVRALLLVLVALVPALFGVRRIFGRGAGAWVVTGLGAMGGTALVAALVLRVAGPGGTVYHSGALWRVAAELVGSRGIDLAGSPRGNVESLRQSWLALSGVDTAGPGAPQPPEGTACRSVIFLVLETAAARDYSVETLRASRPRTGALLEHAVIARRHLASHPTSNRSDWSLFAGFNDMTGSWNSQALLMRAVAPEPPSSIPWILRERGYETSYYYPGIFMIPEDRWAVSYLGFDRVYNGGGRYWRLTPETRLVLERRMFAQAAHDLREGAAPRRPFFLVLRSLAGHDPLFSPRTATTVAPGDRAGRRRAVGELLGVLDSMLAGVLDAAAERESPDRIAVLIVGDHGVRDRLDPDLAGRLFDPVTYHVPMAISCPARFPRPVDVAMTTSHVDVAPTLAWLLDLPAKPWLHSGLVMLDPRLEHRFTFLLGAFANGIDVAIQGDTLVALNRVTGTQHHLLFGEPLLPSTPAFGATGVDAKRYHSWIERLNGLAPLQAATLRYFMVRQGDSRP